MRLVLHIGAHGTDGGLIAGWIARNRDALAAQGIAAPPPRLFLQRLSAALDEGRDAEPLAREEALLRGLGASGQRLRMVVSAPGLLGSAADVLSPEGFYVRDVARRLYGLGSLFPRTRITLLLAVRGARGVIPALLPQEPGAAEALLAHIPDETLPWSRLVATLRHQLPRAGLVAWRHEDLAQVWPGVLQALVGQGAVLPAAGLLDFAATGLGAEARLRLGRYLAEVPASSAGQLRQTAAVFARRYGQGLDSDPAAALPGWARLRLAELDNGYATEWGDLAGREGLRILMPG